MLGAGPALAILVKIVGKILYVGTMPWFLLACILSLSCLAWLGKQQQNENQHFSGYGYHEPFVGCIDVDECTDGNFPNNCGSNTNCANTVGSFTCSCVHDGYTAWSPGPDINKIFKIN